MKRKITFWKLDPKNDWMDRLVFILAICMSIFIVASIIHSFLKEENIQEYLSGHQILKKKAYIIESGKVNDY